MTPPSWFARRGRTQRTDQLPCAAVAAARLTSLRANRSISNMQRSGSGTDSGGPMSTQPPARERSSGSPQTPARRARAPAVGLPAVTAQSAALIAPAAGSVATGIHRRLLRRRDAVLVPDRTDRVRLRRAGDRRVRQTAAERRVVLHLPDQHLRPEDRLRHRGRCCSAPTCCCSRSSSISSGTSSPRCSPGPGMHIRGWCSRPR